MAAEGLSNDLIAARLDTPRQIVSKWRKRFPLARLPGLDALPRGGRQARFSPSLVVHVKALACESPYRRGLPLSWFSVEDIRQEVLAQSWAPRSAEPPSGAGSVRTRSVRGAIVTRPLWITQTLGR